MVDEVDEPINATEPQQTDSVPLFMASRYHTFHKFGKGPKYPRGRRELLPLTWERNH